MAVQNPSAPSAAVSWVLTDPARLAHRCCLFLDVDGTLIDIAGVPDRVWIPNDLRTVLERAAAAVGGALALVSGRTIAVLDSMFEPLKLPSAGIHGLERRDAQGRFYWGSASARVLDRSRRVLKVLVASQPGVEVEDKGTSIALHYRQRPELVELCRSIAMHLATELGPGFHVIQGSMVFELKPSAYSKATALEAFLAEQPFAGRVPVVFGNDATDLDGFAAAVRHGGASIAVGEDVKGTYSLPDSAATRHWLRALAAGVSQ